MCGELSGVELPPGVAVPQCSRGFRFGGKCLCELLTPCRWWVCCRRCCTTVVTPALAVALPCSFPWHREASLQRDLGLLASFAWLAERRIYSRVLFPFLQQFFLLQLYEAFEVSLISLTVPRGMRGSLKERQKIGDLMTYRCSAQPPALW